MEVTGEQDRSQVVGLGNRCYGIGVQLVKRPICLADLGQTTAHYCSLKQCSLTHQQIDVTKIKGVCFS